MPDQPGSFGPWTEGGAEVISSSEAPFWQASTSGILDIGHRSEWDTCQLGKHVLPGLARVSISKPAERKVDVKSPDGKSKATLTIKGWEPAEVEIQLLLWTPIHWSAWRTIRTELRDPADRAESDPLEIHHPVTYDSGIDSILVKSITGVTEGAIRGTKTVKITGIEWVPQPKTTGSGTPKTSNSQPNRKQIEDHWILFTTTGATTDSWEVWARTYGLNPPGPEPPISNSTR